MKVMTLSAESIGLFRNWLRDRGRSDLTVKAYGTDLRTFLEECQEETIDLETEFEEFGMTWLQMNRNSLKPKTVLRRKTSLAAFAKWAGLPSETFADWTGPKPARTIPHPLPEGMEGIHRLVAATNNEKHKALIALCGYVGCRVGEAVSVVPSCVDAEGMMMTIRGKGDKERVVPVTDQAWDILAMPVTRAMLDGGRPIVGIDERFARRKITQLGVMAGLTRKVVSHDLRATLATHVYNRTKDIVWVQHILGHSSPKTTQIYLGIDYEKMREGMQS